MATIERASLTEKAKKPVKKAAKKFDDFYMREFLNTEKQHGLAAVIASMDGDGRAGSLVVSDCNRNITLTFEGWNIAETENAIHKTDVLMKALKGIRERAMERKKALAKEPKKSTKLFKSLKKVDVVEI